MLFVERRVLVFGSKLGSSMQSPLIGQIQVIKVCEAITNFILCTSITGPINLKRRGNTNPRPVVLNELFHVISCDGMGSDWTGCMKANTISAKKNFTLWRLRSPSTSAINAKESGLRFNPVSICSRELKMRLDVKCQRTERDENKLLSDHETVQGAGLPRLLFHSLSSRSESHEWIREMKIFGHESVVSCFTFGFSGAWVTAIVLQTTSGCFVYTS